MNMQDDLVLDPEIRLKKPEMYQVVLLNDDYTPMDFVVAVIQRVFSKGKDEATQLMYDIHNKGRAVCGIYTRELAEAKAYEVVDFARSHEFPLMAYAERQ